MTGWEIFYLILAIIMVIGIIRVFVNRPQTFMDIILEIFCLDLFGEFLAHLLEHIDFD